MKKIIFFLFLIGSYTVFANEKDLTINETVYVEYRNNDFVKGRISRLLDNYTAEVTLERRSGGASFKSIIVDVLIDDLILKRIDETNSLIGRKLVSKKRDNSHERAKAIVIGYRAKDDTILVEYTNRYKFPYFNNISHAVNIVSLEILNNFYIE